MSTTPPRPPERIARAREWLLTQLSQQPWGAQLRSVYRGKWGLSEGQANRDYAAVMHQLKADGDAATNAEKRALFLARLRLVQSINLRALAEHVQHAKRKNLAPDPRVVVGMSHTINKLMITEARVEGFFAPVEVDVSANVNHTLDVEDAEAQLEARRHRQAQNAAVLRDIDARMAQLRLIDGGTERGPG